MYIKHKLDGEELMRVLIYEIKDFGVLDVVETLKNMGHEVLAIEDDRKRERVNAEFDSDFDIKLRALSRICFLPLTIALLYLMPA